MLCYYVVMSFDGFQLSVPCVVIVGVVNVVLHVCYYCFRCVLCYCVLLVYHASVLVCVVVF